MYYTLMYNFDICINQLKETKRIRRVAPDKGGFWEIINPNEP
mgnify:CR=1 FL=1